MNSPRAASRVYPLTPLPVVRTRLAEDPYLNSKYTQMSLDLVNGFIRRSQKTHMVYPAATISLPGLSTSWIVPLESGAWVPIGVKSIHGSERGSGFSRIGICRVGMESGTRLWVSVGTTKSGEL